MSDKLYYNFEALVKFILRRDRVRITVWILILVFITLMVPVAFNDLYPSDTDRMAMAETMKNPAMIAMVGPGFGFANYTIGAMTSNEMLLFTILAVAIMNIFLVVRHTRKDEERGRVEMIRALPAGRLSNLFAAMTAAVTVNIILGLLSGLGLFALGIESMDFGGSMLYGAALCVSGILFAAITALFSQLCSGARGATGYSFAMLGVLYLMRAAGDISNETLACISPLGLILRAEVYVNNYWWPVFAVLGISIIVCCAAFYLNSVRDMDAGFIPQKPGRKTASAFLQGSWGLTLRLLRPTIIAWAVTMFVLGATYGSIMGDMEKFFESNELMKNILPEADGVTLAERFMTMVMSVLSMISVIPVITMVNKLRSEEKRGRAELVLSKSVSRPELMTGYLAISLVCSIAMQFLSVSGLWVAAQAVMKENPITFETFFKAGFVYLPALWLMIGLAVLIIGFLPKAVSFLWMYLGFSFFTVYFGNLLKFPEWVGKLSPFGNVPQVPVDTMNWVSLSVLTILAVITISAGYFGFRQRDLQ